MSRPDWLVAAVCGALVIGGVIRTGDDLRAQDPEPVNPFGKKAAREDARPGYVELSDGSVKPGSLYLTRDARLRLYDDSLKRQRDVPLSAVKKIEATVEKEWLEKEWRFKEAANDEKVFTGRTYPAREYQYAITLNDGRTITGPLAAIFYVQTESEREPLRFLLHKRDKGELDQSLSQLLYVRRIELGDEAFNAGRRKAEEYTKQKAAKKPK